LPEVTQLVEGSDGLFLLGEIICDTNFAVSETKIDMRKTIQALDGRVTIGYHTYSHLPLAALVGRCWRASARATSRWPSRRRSSRTAWWPTRRASRRPTSPPPSTT
jgi:indolepyruvate decarboxylase